MLNRLLPSFLIVIVACAMYGGFLASPIVFDDVRFFNEGILRGMLDNVDLASPRAIPNLTLALSLKWFGDAMVPMRVVSVLLHALVGVSLHVFLREVQYMLLDNKSEQSRSNFWLPLLAAIIFVIHPIAVYGAGYLIERTIVMATLFALWSWYFALRALETDRTTWIWASIGAYALSVACKEHAVMVPAVSVALAIWWWRSCSKQLTLGWILKKYAGAIVVTLIVVWWVVLARKGIIGLPYESGVQTMRVDAIPQPAWLLSVITQGWLFFKYLFLWMLPNPLWMSVDMREPFALAITSWPQSLGFCMFVLWAMVGAYLLFKGGRTGLLGFAMLAPWLLFATEFSTVRYYEIFVLYRSYLWLAPAFVVVLLLESHVSYSLIKLLLVLIPLMLAPLTWNRLMTFSHPFYLWNDAVRLAKDKKDVSGLDRIFVDRGVELHRLGRYDLAVVDFTTAIQYNPKFSPAYGGRASALAESGKALEALPDFDKAIQLEPTFSVYYANKGKALASLNRFREASESFQKACDTGWKTWCATANELRLKANGIKGAATPVPAS